MEFWGELFVYALIGSVFGAISDTISEKRGMGGAFWRGFFLWIIGIIVVAVRPNDKPAIQKGEHDVLYWECKSCGKLYSERVRICTCGGEKFRRVYYTNPVERQNDAFSQQIAELEKWKEMLDKGLITQEEYNVKKREILDI